MDEFLIRHGMTHPDLWMLWFAFLASVLFICDIFGRVMHEIFKEFKDK